MNRSICICGSVGRLGLGLNMITKLKHPAVSRVKATEIALNFLKSLAASFLNAGWLKSQMGPVPLHIPVCLTWFIRGSSSLWSVQAHPDAVRERPHSWESSRGCYSPHQTQLLKRESNGGFDKWRGRSLFQQMNKRKSPFCEAVMVAAAIHVQYNVIQGSTSAINPTFLDLLMFMPFLCLYAGDSQWLEALCLRVVCLFVCPSLCPSHSCEHDISRRKFFRFIRYKYSPRLSDPFVWPKIKVTVSSPNVSWPFETSLKSALYEWERGIQLCSCDCGLLIYFYGHLWCHSLWCFFLELLYIVVDCNYLVHYDSHRLLSH